MKNPNLAISKLIILTIVKQIPAITYNQLTNLALETLYMDYFTYIQAYQELSRDHMLLTGIRKDEHELDASGNPLERCDITRQGESVLSTLDHKIPLHVKTYLLQTTATWRKDLRRQHDVQAIYEPDANGQYKVVLSQNDGVHETIKIQLTIPDRQLAKGICKHWKNQPGSTYVAMLALLTGEINNQKTEASNSDLSTKAKEKDEHSHQEPARPYKQEQRLI